MNQLFFVENLVNESLITASSDEIGTSPENSQFPLSNLKDERRTKVFRSTTTTVSIVFDLGLAREIDAVLLVDSGMSAFGFTGATVQMNMTNSWGLITESVIDVDHLNGFSDLILNTTQTARYVRLNLTNTSGFCELSKIFIGKKSSVGELSFTYPLIYRQNNNAIVQRNRLGQKFIDEINTQKEIEGSFNTINKDELEDLFEILDYASLTRPIWIWFPEGAMTTNNHRLSGYYYLKDDPQMQLVPGQFWNVKLSFEEGM